MTFHFQFNLIQFNTANGHVILTLLNSIPPSPEKRMLVTPPALAALKSQVVDHRHAKSVHISTNAIFAMVELARKSA